MCQTIHHPKALLNVSYLLFDIKPTFLEGVSATSLEDGPHTIEPGESYTFADLSTIYAGCEARGGLSSGRSFVHPVNKGCVVYILKRKVDPLQEPPSLSLASHYVTPTKAIEAVFTRDRWKGPTAIFEQCDDKENLENAMFRFDDYYMKVNCEKLSPRALPFSHLTQRFLKERNLVWSLRRTSKFALPLYRVELCRVRRETRIGVEKWFGRSYTDSLPSTIPSITSEEIRMYSRYIAERGKASDNAVVPSQEAEIDSRPIAEGPKKKRKAKRKKKKEKNEEVKEREPVRETPDKVVVLSEDSSESTWYGLLCSLVGLTSLFAQMTKWLESMQPLINRMETLTASEEENVYALNTLAESTTALEASVPLEEGSSLESDVLAVPTNAPEAGVPVKEDSSSESDSISALECPPALASSPELESLPSLATLPEIESLPGMGSPSKLSGMKAFLCQAISTTFSYPSKGKAPIRDKAPIQDRNIDLNTRTDTSASEISPDADHERLLECLGEKLHIYNYATMSWYLDEKAGNSAVQRGRRTIKRSTALLRERQRGR